MSSTPAAQAQWIRVPASNVLTLAAVAVARSRYPWLDFHDPVAEHLFRELGGEVSGIADIELRTAIGRTVQIDELVRRWALGQRRGCVVELGSGFSTRYARLREFRLPVVSVDEPPGAHARRQVFPERPSFAELTARLAERGWVRAAVGADGAPFVVVEDAFLDADANEVAAILCALAAELPTGSVIAACHGPRARFVVADRTARRASLGVVFGTELARFPRLTWSMEPSPLDGTEHPSIALLEVV